MIILGLGGQKTNKQPLKTVGKIERLEYLYFIWKKALSNNSKGMGGNLGEKKLTKNTGVVSDIASEDIISTMLMDLRRARSFSTSFPNSH